MTDPSYTSELLVLKYPTNFARQTKLLTTVQVYTDQQATQMLEYPDCSNMLTPQT